jgi:hypothetical protein
LSQGCFERVVVVNLATTYLGAAWSNKEEQIMAKRKRLEQRSETVVKTAEVSEETKVVIDNAELSSILTQAQEEDGIHIKLTTGTGTGEG